MEDIFDKFRLKEGEGDFFSNFAMLIPSKPFTTINQKPIPAWKRILCFIVGHKWGTSGVSYVGPGFPRTCRRCKTMKWFKRPTIKMRLATWVDKTISKMWPFCWVGIHRYESHLGYTTYYYGPDLKTPPVRQQTYKCSCCKKIKTITL